MTDKEDVERARPRELWSTEFALEQLRKSADEAQKIAKEFTREVQEFCAKRDARDSGPRNG